MPGRRLPLTSSSWWATLAGAEAGAVAVAVAVACTLLLVALSLLGHDR